MALRLFLSVRPPLLSHHKWFSTHSATGLRPFSDVASVIQKEFRGFRFLFMWRRQQRKAGIYFAMDLQVYGAGCSGNNLFALAFYMGPLVPQHLQM